MAPSRSTTFRDGAAGREQHCAVRVALLALVLVACDQSAQRSSEREQASARAVEHQPSKTAAAPSTPATPPSEAKWVGRQVCRDCHAQVTERYDGSQHDLAMQEANPQTVLGDFGDAPGTTLRYFGKLTRFVREGDAFTVHTEGDDGKRHAYRVAYTFGVSPLQQYLVETAPGQLQALPFAWDSRPKQDGGQRWFHLYPEEKIGPGDPLFWTGAQFNWNRGCADCHSTGLTRGFDRKRQRYQTSWAEIDVSCEACHGPGSVHVERAKAGVKGGDLGLSAQLPKASERRWELSPGDRIAHLALDTRSQELERCAPCHSRRAELGLPGDYHDHYRQSLLEENLYFVDGQVQEEVYVYGSFLQSKMAQAGVRCSDCHEPHSLSLRAQGNALCARCHQPSVFDTPEHHFHAKQGPGTRCVDCHMPTRVYMGVDARREHRFDVPRPDRSVRLGVPEPCTGCHEQRSPEWAARVLREHGYGKRGSGFPEVLDAARHEAMGSFAPLRALIEDVKQPAIVRATAVETLSAAASPATASLLRGAAKDASPLVRRAVAFAGSGLPPAEGARVLTPLLSDPVRSVRLEAVATLLALAPQLPPDVHTRVLGAVAEYRADREANSDSPGALADLAQLALVAGEPAAARSLYQEALARDPAFTAAYTNLADLYRSAGDDERAAQTLERGLALAADPVAIRRALALARVRLGQRAEALDLLAQAYAQRPADIGLGYTYAVALAEEDLKAAIDVLTQLRERHPGSRPVLQALAEYQQRAGDAPAAAESAAALERRTAELR